MVYTYYASLTTTIYILKILLTVNSKELSPNWSTFGDPSSLKSHKAIFSETLHLSMEPPTFSLETTADFHWRPNMKIPEVSDEKPGVSDDN